MKEKIKKVLRKPVLILSIVGSISTIFLLAFMFFFALKFWRTNFPLGYPLDVVAYAVASFVAITTITFQWIDGRIKSIVESFRMLKQKGGLPNVERRKFR